MPSEPNEEVADQIVKQAVDSKIIDDSYAPKLRELLLSGTSNSADWRLLVESSDSKKVKAPKSKKGSD